MQTAKIPHSGSTQRSQGAQVSQLFISTASVHHLEMQGCHEIPVHTLPASHQGSAAAACLQSPPPGHEQMELDRPGAIPPLSVLLSPLFLLLHATHHAALHGPSTPLPLRQDHCLHQEVPPHQAPREQHVPSAPQHPGVIAGALHAPKGQLNR